MSSVGEGHREDVTAGLAQELDPGNWRLRTPSPVLHMCTPLAFPTLEAAQEHSLETEMW